MSYEIHHGDALAVLRTMPEASAHCCVTSPPYWGLRDYGVDGQLGLEASPFEYVDVMVEVFEEVRRVLRDDGTLWLNLGDSYAGSWGAQSRGKGELDPKNPNGGALKRGVSIANQILSAPAKNPGRNPSSFRRDRADAGGLRHKDAGLKPKDLIGVPWRVALALQEAGWWLRSDIIWHKPNPMPESITDRPTKAHEYLFLLAKSESYYYDAAAIAEKVAISQLGRVRDGVVGGKSHEERGQHSQGGLYRGPNGKNAATAQQASGRRMMENAKAARDAGGEHDAPFGEKRNRRSVWTINTQAFAEAHFATFPEDLVRPCILAGCAHGGTVLDPFAGSGTTLLVAEKLGCHGIGIELNEEYINIARRRLSQPSLAL